MIENERSFLVAKTPKLDGVIRKEISQHYLSDGEESLRIRRAGGTYELTKKRAIDPEDLSRKEELTIPLEREEYYLLEPLAKRGLEKTRYYLGLPDGLTAELDVFGGPLKGLAMVEVEFPDEKTREAFVPPDWFGRDISQEAWSSNASLAGKTFRQIAEHVGARTKAGARKAKK
jgi:adenylate cyclase